jgi:micrococcal nuclease
VQILTKWKEHNRKSVQKYFQIKNIHVQPFWIVEEVLDGDSLKIKQEFTQERREIRLYGLDAPEFIFQENARG